MGDYNFQDERIFQDGPGREFSLELFEQKLGINITNISKSGCDMQFDMSGVGNVCFPNTIRRILLNEVPTVAIERCEFYNNTSIIQDEVLANRLGLIPLNVDPRLMCSFENRRCFKSSDPLSNDDLDEKRISLHRFPYLVQIHCIRNPAAEPSSNDPSELYLNRNVYSSHLTWEPFGGQAELFGQKRPAPVESDILIAKLVPGQEIDVKMFCVKGVGSEHAKFSPVATAFYRLLPKIELLSPIENDDADELASCFPSGTIHVVTERCDDGSLVRRAVVADVHKASCSREVGRHSSLRDRVKVGLDHDCALFSVESTGALSATELVLEASKVLVKKCDVLIDCAEKLSNDLETFNALNV